MLVVNKCVVNILKFVEKNEIIDFDGDNWFDLHEIILIMGLDFGPLWG